LGVGLLCTLGAGVAVGVNKIRNDQIDATPLLAIETSSKVKPNTGVPAAQRLREDAVGAKAPLLLVTQATMPTTKPALPQRAAAPTTMPAAVVASIEPKLTTPPPVQTKPAEPQLTGNPLTDGQTLIDRNDPVGAREVLNAALFEGKLSGADVTLAKQRMAKLNESLIFGRRAYRNDPFAGAYTVRSGELLQTIARNHGLGWEFLGRLNNISDPRRLRAMQTLKVVKGPFHAVVSKRAFTLDVYLGSPGQAGAMYVTTFNVGLGKDSSTPTGTWVAHNKLKNPEYYSPRGEGIIPADDPANPLGEYWIGLRGIEGQALGSESYGIHGTIEPETIGKEESMGCIRLANEDAGRVFELLVENKSMVVVRE
jgi:hypothetical protein